MIGIFPKGQAEQAQTPPSQPPCLDTRTDAYPRSRSWSSRGDWLPRWRKAWDWLTLEVALWVQ